MEAFKHGFDGACKPGGAVFGAYHTFSVGIFQWLPKSGGKGLKRSAVKYRIKGRYDNAEAVYARAREVCAMFDSGDAPAKKSEGI